MKCEVQSIDRLVASVRRLRTLVDTFELSGEQVPEELSEPLAEIERLIGEIEPPPLPSKPKANSATGSSLTA